MDDTEKLMKELEEMLQQTNGLIKNFEQFPDDDFCVRFVTHLKEVRSIGVAYTYKLKEYESSKSFDTMLELKTLSILMEQKKVEALEYMEEAIKLYL